MCFQRNTAPGGWNTKKCVNYQLQIPAPLDVQNAITELQHRKVLFTYAEVKCTQSFTNCNLGSLCQQWLQINKSYYVWNTPFVWLLLQLDRVLFHRLLLPGRIAAIPKKRNSCVSKIIWYECICTHNLDELQLHNCISENGLLFFLNMLIKLTDDVITLH